MRKTICAAFAIWLLAAATARAELLKPGDNLLTLSGAGDTPKDGTAFSFGVSVQLSHMVTSNIEVLIADTPAYTDVAGANWQNSVEVGAAYNFTGLGWDKFIPYVGATCGYQSGAGDDGGFTNLFGGTRYFINDTVFAFGQVGYSLSWTHGDDASEFKYRLGLGCRF